MPDITVITPVLNGRGYIESCILNVVDQRCGSVEHLIIDGGSTDGTLDVITKYAKYCSHINFISEKDRGQSDAMNKGLGLAKGSVIGYLNVDDYYQPGVLNRVLDLFRGLPGYSMVVGNCLVWDGNGKLLYVNKPLRLQFKDLLSGKPYPVNPSSYFYHKRIHAIIGVYDINDNYSMDLDFLLRAVRVSNVIYVDENLGNFVFHKGTKTFRDSDYSFSRVENLVIKYRDRLDLLSRLQVILNFGFFKLERNGFRNLKRILEVFACLTCLPGW